MQTMTEEAAKAWMSVEEAAHYLEVSEKTIRRHIRDETLPTYRLGGKGKHRILKSDLIGLLAQSKASGKHDTTHN